MTRALTAALALLLVVTFAAPAAAAPARYARAAAANTALLAEVVRGEGVDYVALRGPAAPRLAAALAGLRGLEAAKLTAGELEALELDLYNLSVLAEVARRWHPGFSPADSAFAMFHTPCVPFRGHTLTLDALENEVIRPEAMDPRVHVALCCAARSCPPLGPRAFMSGPLDSLLAANLARFVHDPARNRVNSHAKTLTLSRLFDWYAADFGGAANVAATFGRMAGIDTRGYTVQFLDYDWTLNAALPPR